MALIAAVAGGCGREAPPAGPGDPQGRLFAVTFQTMNNPFFVDLNEGLGRVIESHGDRLVTLDAQFNSLKQKNDISDVLQQKPAAIFLNPVNWEGIKGSLEPGRLADLVVWDHDLLSIDPANLMSVKPERTMLGGRWVYEA